MVISHMGVCEIQQGFTQGYISNEKTTMEVREWNRWTRIHNRGDVMNFIIFFIMSIAVIWGILEYFGVGNDWLDCFYNDWCGNTNERGCGGLVMWLGRRIV